jgi:hypothetical protein
MYFDIVTNYNECLEFVDSESDEYETPEAQVWRKFLGEHQLRICMNAIQAVGACEGASTSFLGYACLSIARRHIAFRCQSRRPTESWATVEC